MTARILTTTLALAGLLALPAVAAAHGPPVVSGGPTGTTKERKAEFKITYDEFVVNQSFECKLDDQPWAPCTESEMPEGKAVYEDLADGPHSFQARRVVTGPVPEPFTADETPSEPRKWTVDGTAPKTTIGAAPVSGPETAARAEFSASEGGATFECSLDGAAFAACASPLELTGLAVGDHVLKVRATDGAGNVEAEPASATWSVLPPPPPVAPPVAPGPPGLPAGTVPTITVGKAVRRPKPGCARKRSSKKRRACRRAASRAATRAA